MTKQDYWNATRYDTQHAFVSHYGKDILSLLQPQQGETIVDVGCGTGDLAHELSKQGVHVIGIDASPNMITTAKEKYPHIPFYVQSATQLTGFSNVDVVFSNATLHWVKEPFTALHSMYAILKSGGRFVAEFGGAHNVETITHAIIDEIRHAGYRFDDAQFPWYYPSIAEYTTLMEAAGFHVTFAEHINRPTPLQSDEGLRNWMYMFADGLFEGIEKNAKDRIIKKVEERLRDVLWQDGEWIADYKRIRVVGVK